LTVLDGIAGFVYGVMTGLTAGGLYDVATKKIFGVEDSV